MIRRRIALVVLSSVMVLLVPTGGGAHTGWSVSGSFIASPVPQPTGLVGMPLFFLSGCNDALLQEEGVSFSLVKLPAGVAGHKATITWSSTAGPVFALWLQFMGGDNTCNQQGDYIPVYQSPYTFTVHAKARYVVLSGEAAAGVNWTITGTSH